MQNISCLVLKEEDESLFIIGLESISMMHNIIRVLINSKSISKILTFFIESTFKILKNSILLK